MESRVEKKLYKFQEQCLSELLNGKHIAILRMGAGKSAVAMRWAMGTHKPNVLVITTPSKRDTRLPDGRSDFEAEADEWCGEEWRKSLSSFVVISWAGLRRWCAEQTAHDDALHDWCIVADEVMYAKSGARSQRGKAFLQIARRTDVWAGFTGTPGDRWEDFQAYAIATKKVKNLTEFRRRFCILQTFRGFPEIIGYQNEDELQSWWDDVSTRPDDSQIDAELPKQVHRTISLPLPKGYKKVVKDHETLEGEFIENTPQMTHYLRQLCILDKARQQWLRDYLETNPEPTLFFTNYKAEAQMVADICAKVRPDAKVWKIDGDNHDVPTKDTLGEHDIVVANYQSGAEGLNLQFMQYCVFVSLNYSYTKSQQARGRIRRIGQDKTQVYYYLTCAEGIDQDVLKALRAKSDFSESTWTPQ